MAGESSGDKPRDRNSPDKLDVLGPTGAPEKRVTEEAKAGHVSKPRGSQG